MKEQKERFSKLERAFKILEYLKLNSDSEHTVTQAALRRESEIEPYLGDKETYNDTIVKMAMALNFDEYGLLLLSVDKAILPQPFIKICLPCYGVMKSSKSEIATFLVKLVPIFSSKTTLIDEPEVFLSV